MLRVIGVILDILVLIVFTIDYLKAKEYIDELNHMRHEIWKLQHEVYEQGNHMRRQAHGEKVSY